MKITTAARALTACLAVAGAATTAAAAVVPLDTSGVQPGPVTVVETDDAVVVARRLIREGIAVSVAH